MANVIILHPTLETRLGIKRMLLEVDPAAQVLVFAHPRLALTAALPRDLSAFDYVIASDLFDLTDLAQFIDRCHQGQGASKVTVIVVVTPGQEGTESVSTQLVTGVHGFLSEPVSLQSLEEALALALQVHNTSSANRYRAGAGLFLYGLEPKEAHRDGASLWASVNKLCDDFKVATGDSVSGVVQPLLRLGPSERLTLFSSLKAKLRSALQVKSPGPGQK